MFKSGVWASFGKGKHSRGSLFNQGESLSCLVWSSCSVWLVNFIFTLQTAWNSHYITHITEMWNLHLMEHLAWLVFVFGGIWLERTNLQCVFVCPFCSDGLCMHRTFLWVRFEAWDSRQYIQRKIKYSPQESSCCKVQSQKYNLISPVDRPMNWQEP